MNTHKIILGDCIAGMKTMPAGCVQTCITSPPYWGLRDYGHTDQLGAEKTPEEYIENMVAVFREVRRILRNDGTVWLNLGDSYARNGGGVESKMNTIHKMGVGQKATYLAGGMQTINKVPFGLKSKDLVGIPWRVAFALQADGWYLRQDIIWSKPNPMPESVTDRCTKSHEYIFLLSKKKHYYFDHEAIQEPAAESSAARSLRGVSDTHKNVDGAPGQTPHSMNKPRKNARAFGAKVQVGTKQGDVGNTFLNTGKRNKRTVWTVTTKPFRGAHFATYPKDLIEPCVLAGCPVGGTVFDPFTGSGTTAIVAMNHGRNFIGTELNPEYIKIAESRIADEVPITLEGAFE